MQQRSTRGIQYEDVAQAADALLQEGARPTIERIRLHIGRGSPNTVSPMLEQWFSGLGQRLGMVDLPGQGADVPDAVLQSAKELWKMAAAEATARSELACSDERAALNKEAQKLEEGRRELEARENAVSARVKTMQEALQLCTRQLEESNARWQESQRTVSAQSMQIALNQALLVRSREEAAALQQRLDSAQIQAKEESSALNERHRHSERRWLAEVDRARQEMRKSALLAQQNEDKLALLQQQAESLKDKNQAKKLEHALQVNALRNELAHALQDAEKTRFLFQQAQQHTQQRLGIFNLEKNEIALKHRAASRRTPPIRKKLGKNRQ